MDMKITHRASHKKDLCIRRSLVLSRTGKHQQGGLIAVLRQQSASKTTNSKNGPGIGVFWRVFLAKRGNINQSKAVVSNQTTWTLTKGSHHHFEGPSAPQTKQDRPPSRVLDPPCSGTSPMPARLLSAKSSPKTAPKLLPWTSVLWIPGVSMTL